MHGNVREWCADLYREKLPGGVDPLGATTGFDRVVRSGSWFDQAQVCRAANRDMDKPDRRSHYIGFRLAAVREVSAAPENASEVAPMDIPKTTERINFDGGVVGQSIQIEIGQGQQMTFQFCPPGSFMMGSPASEAGRSKNENQVRVRFGQGFWLGQTEVTQRQWEAVMRNNPSSFKGDDLPVEQVSWDDTQAFIEKLNDSVPLPVGWKYGLPSEAQWEYACRAGTERVFHFGNSLSSREANFDGDSPYGSGAKGPCLERTCAVGLYQPNGWGLYDMHGNVWEWCQDAWDGSSGPPGGANPLSLFGSFRLARGGSWIDDALYCRSSLRYKVVPGHRFNYLGLRVAVVPAGGPFR
jgi:formylglycine-generating enzyme required for sulfatase activity